jgi:hypothetical protein
MREKEKREEPYETGKGDTGYQPLQHFILEIYGYGGKSRGDDASFFFSFL